MAHYIGKRKGGKWVDRTYVLERISGLSKKDLIIQTFRCPGKGGQNVNKRDTGVRLIHKETNIRAECVEHRTQAENKKVAFWKLIERLSEHYNNEYEEQLEKKMAQEVDNRTVRSYNECRAEVKDHRTGNVYQYQKVINGDLTNIVLDNMISE